MKVIIYINVNFVTIYEHYYNIYICPNRRTILLNTVASKISSSSNTIAQNAQSVLFRSSMPHYFELL